MPLPPLLRLYRFARGDGALTISVAFLALFVFVLYPMWELKAISRAWLDFAMAIVMAFGAMFVFEPKPLVRWFLGFLGAAVALRLFDQWTNFERPWLITLGSLAAMGACATFGALLLIRVMRDGHINANRIVGAIGTYLLIGVVFGLAFKLLALHVDGAYAIGGVPATFADIEPRLSYFSFITLTSTGYGDITPLHPYARSLAVLEALAGNLYLTVLVARLVGLEMEWREERREKRRRHEPPPQ
jgi:hypothetical protein